MRKATQLSGVSKREEELRERVNDLNAFVEVRVQIGLGTGTADRRCPVLLAFLLVLIQTLRHSAGRVVLHDACFHSCTLTHLVKPSLSLLQTHAAAPRC